MYLDRKQHKLWLSLHTQLFWFDNNLFSVALQLKIWNWNAFKNVIQKLCTISLTRRTRRAQTSLAEADHYSHIAHCKNVEPWWWKANLKGFGSLPAPRSGYATASVVFFAHLLILEYSDHHRNLISSSLYYPGPLHKISL